LNEDFTSEQKDPDKVKDILRGKTLKIYMYLLQHPGPLSLREIQKGATISSPSLASYHLDKLVHMELVSVDAHGVYSFKRYVKAGILQLFVGRGIYLVPRYLFYAVFYTSVLPISFLFIPFSLGPLSILLLFVLAFGAITSWVEAIKAWKLEV
jgi:hypothetical protein